MADCTQCADYEWCAKNEECGMFEPKPITNYDRIRAMSVEEMAEFMNCGACPPGKDVSELCHDTDGGSVPDLCNLCWLNWLKQEVSTNG